MARASVDEKSTDWYREVEILVQWGEPARRRRCFFGA